MESHDVRTADGPTDEQILVLLQRHQRLSFLTLAESLPTYTWRSLFVALNRLCHQEHLELMPLAGDYEVVWRNRRQRPAGNPKDLWMRM
ncbi:MAG: hypothetical protein OJF47_004186 [Nitrospira sp.]|jgi:hypothetical protein|nr:MAG: hypothetical protein OJF47_004186 [Nitrospira sp.]